MMIIFIPGKDTFTFDELVKVMERLKTQPEFSEEDFKDSFKVSYYQIQNA